MRELDEHPAPPLTLSVTATDPFISFSRENGVWENGVWTLNPAPNVP
jgi:hypothetical protein